jgi:hypothetical protein
MDSHGLAISANVKAGRLGATRCKDMFHLRGKARWLLCVAASSCSVPAWTPVGLPCDETHPCPDGTFCVDRVCEVESASGGCTENSDCAEVCIMGACAARSSTGGSCDETPDCVANHTCSSNTCLGTPGAACTMDTHCAAGHCECLDPGCTSRACAPVDCPCLYDDDVDGVCDGVLDDGIADVCSPSSGCYDGSCKLLEGQGCSADADCGSWQCECTTASCWPRVCSANDCECGYAADGGCGLMLPSGLDDPEDCVLAGYSCYGGACGLDGPTWWNTNYTRRRQLVVSNTSADVLDPGVHLAWDPGDTLRAFGHGLRIARHNGGSWAQVPRVIDSFAPSSLWFEAIVAIAASGTDTSYWAYYQPVSPPSSSFTPAEVFDFYESFEGFDAAASTRWVPSSTTIGTVTHGVETYVHLNSATSDQMYSHAANGYAWGHESAVDIRWRVTASGGPFWLGYQGFQGASPSQLAMDTGPWILFLRRTTGQLITEHVCSQNDATADGPGSVAYGSFAIDTDYVTSIDRYFTTVMFRLDFAAPQTRTVCSELSSVAPLMPIRLNMSGTSTYLDVDMVRVRRSLQPLPQVTTTGVEQVYP